MERGLTQQEIRDIVSGLELTHFRRLLEEFLSTGELLEDRSSVTGSGDLNLNEKYPPKQSLINPPKADFMRDSDQNPTDPLRIDYHSLLILKPIRPATGIDTRSTKPPIKRR